MPKTNLPLLLGSLACGITAAGFLAVIIHTIIGALK